MTKVIYLDNNCDLNEPR